MSIFKEIMNNFKFKISLKAAVILMLVILTACGGFQKVDQRQRPDGSKAKARKNIEEGRGASIGSLGKRLGKTTYEFSTSNPMWRASLETLDFLPLSTVDYSGGVIITDWYSDSNSAKESIKISLRFLGNEIRSESLKVIVHQKTCSSNLDCRVILLSDTKIKEELHSAILKKAALLEKESKKKKKK
tara:strand:+ start:88 stop:648 length:561 start_codon:yes stop_codon:yes gene_type:complete